MRTVALMSCLKDLSELYQTGPGEERTTGEENTKDEEGD